MTETSKSEKKHSGELIIMLLLPLVLSIILSIITTISSFFSTLFLCFLIWALTITVLHGFGYLSIFKILFKIIITFSLKPLEEDEVNDDHKWAKRRSWVLLPLSILIFWLSSRFFMGGNSTEILIYIIAGGTYGGLSYYLILIDYFHPAEWL